MKTYRISLGKIISDDLESWFEECRHETKDGKSYLIFSSADQAQLFGILGTIQNLGLPLLEVEILKGNN